MHWDKIKQGRRDTRSAPLYPVLEKASERREWLIKSLKEMQVTKQVRRMAAGRPFSDKGSKCQCPGVPMEENSSNVVREGEHRRRQDQRDQSQIT